MIWDPAQYQRYEAERLRPALELIQRTCVESPQSIVDLGCGTGSVTDLLRKRWPEAAITAIDNSEEMLAVAAERDAGIRWTRGDINHWESDSVVDLIFSNAALHWIDDHEKLFTRLLLYLNSAGALAVQMPSNFDQPYHVALVDTVQSGLWCATLQPLLRQDAVQAPRYYYDLLAPQCTRIDIWETEYLHVLDGENPVAEWAKGTLLRPFLSALSKQQRVAFEAEYRRRVRNAYSQDAGGRTVFPFKRLFIVAAMP